MKKYGTENREIIKFAGQSMEKLTDEIAIEFPLTIYINGEEFATLVCTPADMEELVTGFLASEGLIRFLKDITSFSLDKDRGFIYVELNYNPDLKKQEHSKRFIGSCCGKSRQFYLQSDVKTAKTVRNKTKISIAQCTKLMEEMQKSSFAFHSTGGFHNAALCDTHQLIVARSDIGRHNALDKVYGYCIHHHLSLSDKVIAFSGRISSEVLLKVSKIGAGIVLSKSAPTTLALDLAEDLGITTVGFVRGKRLNVYTHPERIENE